MIDAVSAIAATCCILFALAAPIGIISFKLSVKSKQNFLGKVGNIIDPLVASYIIGIAIGNTGIVLNDSVNDIVDFFSQAAVAIALPLLLFSADITAIRVAGWRCIIALILILLAVLVSSLFAWLIFRDILDIQVVANVAGLAAASSTGGTANMAAARVALDVDADTYIAANTSDIIAGGVFILLLVTIMKPTLSRCLRPYRYSEKPLAKREKNKTKTSNHDTDKTILIDGDEKPPVYNQASTPAKSIEDPSYEQTTDDENYIKESSLEDGNSDSNIELSTGRVDSPDGSKADSTSDSIDTYKIMCQKKNLRFIVIGFCLSLVFVGIGFGLGMAVPKEDLSMLVTILAIVTLALFASLHPKVRQLQYTFTLGQYIILVFSVAVGLLADVSKFVDSAAGIFGTVIVTEWGAICVAIIFAMICRVDVDTFIVILVSCVLSPPLIPMAINATKNTELLVPGIAVGVIGYAIGTYLGVGISQLLIAI